MRHASAQTYRRTYRHTHSNTLHPHKGRSEYGLGASIQVITGEVINGYRTVIITQTLIACNEQHLCFLMPAIYRIVKSCIPCLLRKYSFFFGGGGKIPPEHAWIKQWLQRVLELRVAATEYRLKLEFHCFDLWWIFCTIKFTTNLQRIESACATTSPQHSTKSYNKSTTNRSSGV